MTPIVTNIARQILKAKKPIYVFLAVVAISSASAFFLAPYFGNSLAELRYCDRSQKFTQTELEHCEAFQLYSDGKFEDAQILLEYLAANGSADAQYLLARGLSIGGPVILPFLRVSESRTL